MDTLFPRIFKNYEITTNVTDKNTKFTTKTLKCSSPRFFFQVIIVHCILSYNWEVFQNSLLFGSIFYGRKIIIISSLLTGLSN